jgi:hypothetical protein
LIPNQASPEKPAITAILETLRGTSAASFNNPPDLISSNFPDLGRESFGVLKSVYLLAKSEHIPDFHKRS